VAAKPSTKALRRLRAHVNVAADEEEAEADAEPEAPDADPDVVCEAPAVSPEDVKGEDPVAATVDPLFAPAKVAVALEGEPVPVGVMVTCCGTAGPVVA
jgi:hypothetical protein